MDRRGAQRKRDRAVKQLRALGMTDAEIEAELGVPLTPEIIDVEVVSVPENQQDSIVRNLPAVIETAWNEKGMEDQSGSEYVKPTYQERPGRTADNRSTIKENVEQYDSTLAEYAERRCVATNSRGERCRRWAIMGSRVCKTHGGSTRHIVNKARIRVEMASNRLMGKLIEVAFDDSKPAAVQLDAIKDSLNRAGLKPREQVEIGPIKPHEEIFEDIASGSRAESRRARGIQDTESVDSESISATGYKHPPAPVAPDSSADQSPRHSDCDPPAATQADERERRAREYRTLHITGEDAIRLAYEANREAGSLRALPPGRSAG